MKLTSMGVRGTHTAQAGSPQRSMRIAATLALLASTSCHSPGALGQDGGGGADGGDLVDLASPGPLPLITEFMTSNQGGLTDEDGEPSDWIEIHNPGGAPYDLGGHHLTDSRGNSKRWTFPADTVLAPGAYLVVFASGKDRAVAGRPLHTNFSLSSGDGCTGRGEHLALTSRSGAPLPPLWSPYPAQAGGISYGLLSATATSESASFTRPTPGEPNDPTAARAERVTFDPPSRTFSAAAPLVVSLAVASQTATIRYTTNRARPIAAAGRLVQARADAATGTFALTAHGFADGELVRVTGPAPLVSKVSYFVRVQDADTLRLAVAPDADRARTGGRRGVDADGQLAGPRVLEHIVDTVLYFEGDTHSSFRLIRAIKNRFGAVNEIGVFAMTERGLKGVSNPSAIFLSQHSEPVPGSCVMVTLEGTRPMLVEIQALVDTGGPSPRRLSVGLDRDRLAMLLAVLHRHAGVNCMDQDVFVNAVGGVRIGEPAADLAVMLAIQSSLRGRPLPRGFIAFGEVGLAGEVRPAPRGQDRLKEAAKLGFSHALVPKANAPKQAIKGLDVIAVDRVEQAIERMREW